MRKSILAREYGRKEARYWKDTNEIQLSRNEPQYDLEYMLSVAWRKGYESGQRATRKQAKEKK